MMLTFLLLATIDLCAQTHAIEILELKDKLSKHISNDIAKVDLLNDLSYAYRRTSATKIDTFARAALALADSLNYDRGMAIAYKNLGNSLFKLGGTYDDVKKLNEKCYEIATKAKDYYNQSACLNNIGIAYKVNLNYSESIKTFQLALKIHQEHLEFDRLRLIILGNIGKTFMDMEDFENAKTYLKEVTELANRTGHTQIEVMYMDDYAKVMYHNGATEEAIASIKHNLSQAKEIGDFHSFVQVSDLLSNILIKENRSEEAELYITDALKIANEKAFRVEECNLMLIYSKIISKLDTPENSLQFAELAYECSSEASNSHQEMLAAKNLLETYLLLGRTSLAEKMFKAYDELNKQHFDLAQQKTYATLEVQYQNKQKESENELLRAQKIRDDATIKLQRVLAGSFLLSGLLLSSFIFLLYRSKRNQNNILDNKVKERTVKLDQSNKELAISNRHLEKSNEELEQFAYIASHDLKQPLNTIISFSGLLEKEMNTDSDEKSKTYLKYILNGSNKMKHLIEDILEFSRINKEENNSELLCLAEIVGDVRESISDLINRKQAKIVIKSDLPCIQYERTKLYLLIKNLIENGIKYNDSKPPVIKLHTLEKEDYLRLSFTDNGIGIENQYFPKLFKMFSRLHNQNEYEGTGLGLSLCKKIVENMGGQISLESKIGKGSIFHVDIPKNFIKDSLHSNAISAKKQVEQVTLV